MINGGFTEQHLSCVNNQLITPIAVRPEGTLCSRVLTVESSYAVMAATALPVCDNPQLSCCPLAVQHLLS